jgi:hypothetical protein
MPSKPVPKTFVAARDFKHGRKLYRKGDPVTIRRTMDLLSRRGDRWITRAPKPATAETPAEPSAVLPEPKEG